jgi:low affinity Fe/Cu permease
MNDRAERLMASPRGFAGFFAITAALMAVDATIANLFISIATAALVLLQLGPGRADRAAVHAKLDEALVALKHARNALIHAEEQDEAAIAELRR